jgi:LysR family transcriptional regulator, nitrogen assimilation regulatory protein
LVDLRGLRYFLAIAEAGSVASAARALRIAQPALSRALAALENQLGVPLFVRHRRGVELTEAGVLLRDRARGLLQDVEQVRNEVAAKSTEPSGRLSFGIPPSLSAAITVPLVERFCSQYPKVAFSIQEGPTETLAAELSAGRLDATLATMGEPTHYFQSEIVANDHMALVAPPGVKLPKGPVDIGALVGKRLIVMSHAGFMLDRLVYTAAQAGSRLQFALSINSMTCLRLVEAGIGYSIVPMVAMKTPSWRHLPARPIRDLPLQWVLCTLPNRPVTAAFRALRKTLLEVLSQSS